MTNKHNSKEDTWRDMVEKIEKGELQQCDCCGKVKAGDFICGTCEDCI